MKLAEIRQLPMVASANEWRDRTYINLKGNGGNFAGERNSKIWIARDGKLNFERGKGMTSREWESQLQELQILAANKATV